MREGQPSGEREDTLRDGRADGFTVERLMTRVFEHRRLFAGVMVGAALLAVLMKLLGHPSYTAKVSFLPTSQGSANSALAGLASQVGINVGGDGGEDSPEFYADFLMSDELLGVLASGRYHMRELGHDTALVDYLGIAPADSSVRIEKAITSLRAQMSSAISAKTGVVTLTARFGDPELSFEVVSRAMDLVNQFNVQSRQSQARAQRSFLESQVRSTSADLRAAEDSLLQFLVRNRDYRNSPTLSFEYDRLQRSVSMRQAAHSQVFESFLQAQSAEVQNTPVITIVGPPRVPALRDPRHLASRALLAMLVAALGVLVAFVLDDGWRDLVRRDPHLAMAAESTLGELRRWSDWLMRRQPQAK